MLLRVSLILLVHWSVRLPRLLKASHYCPALRRDPWRLFVVTGRSLLWLGATVSSVWRLMRGREADLLVSSTQLNSTHPHTSQLTLSNLKYQIQPHNHRGQYEEKSRCWPIFFYHQKSIDLIILGLEFTSEFIFLPLARGTLTPKSSHVLTAQNKD